MAVKRRKEKKNKMKELIKNSRKIKCCFCDAKENCKRRAYKEHSEEMGISTHCSITPNKKKKAKKKKKSFMEKAVSSL